VTAAVLMYRAVTYLPSIPPRRPRLPYLAVCTRAHQHQPVHAAPADPQHDDGTRQLAADLTGSAGTADGSVPVGDTPGYGASPGSYFWLRQPTVTPGPGSGGSENRAALPGLLHPPGACLSGDLGWRLRPGG
jgi:hypothetical protein